MKRLTEWRFIILLVGLWLSLEVAHCQNLSTHRNTSRCYNTSSGKTCLTAFFVNNSQPVRKSFEEANRWCNSAVPASSLIVINSPESQRIVESFIEGRDLENEAIILDGRKLSAGNKTEWSWVNGQATSIGRTEKFFDRACVKSKHGQSLVYCFGYARSQCRYICENSDPHTYSRSGFSHRQNNTTYVASQEVATWYDARKECLRLGGDLASITALETIENWSQLKKEETQRFWIGLHRNKWVWRNTDDAITYTNWEGGHPFESTVRQCICLRPQCRRKDGRTICEATGDRKWLTCDCNQSYAFACQKEMLQSTTADLQSSASFPVVTSTLSHRISRKSLSTEIASTSARGKTTEHTTLTTLIATATTTTLSTTSTKTSIATTPITSKKVASTPLLKLVISNVTTHATITADSTAKWIGIMTVSTPSSTQIPSSHFPENQTTAFSSSPKGLFESFSTKEILFVLALLVAAAFIFAAVILIIRKRRNDRRSEGSPLRNTGQNEEVSSVNATVVSANRPSEGTVSPDKIIYAAVKKTQQPAPSNLINASVQSSSEAVASDKSVICMNLDFPTKDQQKTESVNKIAASVSTIYSQPYEPPISANNTDYEEPVKSDETNRPTA